MAQDPIRTRTGLILGKFLPPHMGHQYLFDFARHHAQFVTVVVGTLEREPIPGTLRFEWVREMAYGARVVHIEENLPQDPSEHPDFWDIWKDALLDVAERPDAVFASEHYGARLAEVLGAKFVPVDIARELVPVSGTAIRDNPMAHWAYIPPCVRPYFVKRVCLFGPESTGKSDLARRLAKHYGTLYAQEYARPMLALQDNRCDFDDIERIFWGQRASEDALARQANRLLICDTDNLTTTVWSDALFGKCEDWMRQSAAKRRYDLTLLFDVNCPWIDDGTRFFENNRQGFMARCVKALEGAGRPYVTIGGTWDQRFAAACLEIDRLINP